MVRGDAAALGAGAAEPRAHRRRGGRVHRRPRAAGPVDAPAGHLLGVEAMSLYRYVPGREQLLDAVVERIVDEMAERPGRPRRSRARLAGLPPATRPRHPAGRAGPPEGVPAGGVPAGRGAVAAAAAAEPALGRGVPRRPRPTRGSATTPRSRRTAPSPASCSATCCSRSPHSAPTSGPLDVVEEEDADTSLAPYPNVRRLRGAAARGPLRRPSSRTPWRTCCSGSR